MFLIVDLVFTQLVIVVSGPESYDFFVRFSHGFSSFWVISLADDVAMLYIEANGLKFDNAIYNSLIIKVHLMMSNLSTVLPALQEFVVNCNDLLSRTYQSFAASTHDTCRHLENIFET